MIDNLRGQLDKKEEERRQEKRKLELDFDDGNMDEEIIDEEELSMLKDMKELKREYRTSFNGLKSIKQEL